MSTEKSTWGGSRGGGRPRGTRQKAVCLRLSEESAEWLSAASQNKSQYVDQLLLEDKRQKALRANAKLDELTLDEIALNML